MAAQNQTIPSHPGSLIYIQKRRNSQEERPLKSLLNVILNILLSPLTLIVHLPPLLLLLAITLNRGSDATNRALRTVCRALTQVLQVATRFSLLARVVLINALAAQVLGAGYVAQRFFRRADSLVPCSGVLGSIIGLAFLLVICIL